jgi:hypothetical protein
MTSSHDPANRTLTCPAGLTRQITKAGNAVFGNACGECTLRARCTTAKDGRTVKVHEHDLLQRQHRARAADDSFKATYRQHRPMVERTIAWLVRGTRRVPYRGTEKNNNWLHHRIAALNLRRLIALGLTVDNGCWALA